MLQSFIKEQGFAIIPDVLAPNEVEALWTCSSDGMLQRSKAGARHALRHPLISTIANDHRLMEIAREVLGPDAFPFRATLFDKSPTSNWLVVWHQDTALPLEECREVEGWGPWSVKEGVNYAHAPASALEKILALRIHLDDSTELNGPLKVIPGTHNRGVLSDKEIHEFAAHTPVGDCIVRSGGILAMRPLIVHSSSKSRVGDPRRVIHIEYANSLTPATGLRLAIC